MTNRAVIYARVSTDEQELEQQISSCVKYCELKGWLYEVYKETKSSTKARPIFSHVLNRCRSNHFNNLVVFRFDRAWRSSRQFILDFDSLSVRGVGVVSVMEGLDTTTPLGKAMMTILVALGELERTNISIATKQRLQALKNLGRTLGRPKGSKDHVARKKGGYYARYDKKRKEDVGDGK
jgi:DNA invertase Pin-like site-specific DNA recombinase